MRQIRTIKGSFTKEYLDSLLGEPSWEWDTSEAKKPKCGLASGTLPTAGWGSSAACCRIWIHKDGICVAPGLSISSDIEYAESIYQTLIGKIGV